MLVYGRNVAKEILKKDEKIKKIIIQKDFSDKEILSLIEKRKLKPEIMDKNDFSRFAKFSHQGIILDIGDFAYSEVEEMISDPDSFVVILDHLEDPHNLGAIIRTCEAAGVNGIIIPKDRSVSVNATVMKTSAGALENMKIAMVTNLLQVINKLKKEINIKRKMLLSQQESLKREEQIKKELYEITLRKEILIKTEANLNSKKIEAKKILRRQNLNKEDLEKVKMIMAYCKRKSSLIISELNNETYDETGIKMLIKEILVDASKLNITGEVIVSKMNINSYMMSNIYEVIFNVIEKISNTNIMIFIENGSNIEIKIIIGNIIKVKDKISKSSHNIVITEKHYETDTELKVIIKKEVSK
mgnify:CR=1 FL=1